MGDAGYVSGVREKDRKGWKTAATVILFICALPVLLPAALGVGALALGILLALAGGGIAVIVGAAGCVIAGVCCLAAMLFCSLVGSGFGLVMLFSTPASGLAVLGTSLMAAGAGILGCLIVWQAARFLIWAARKLANWLHLRFFTGKRKKAGVDAEENERSRDARIEDMRMESVRSESMWPDSMQEEGAHMEGQAESVRAEDMGEENGYEA